MTNKMNITVSGGTGIFGATSQGNATNVSGIASITQEETEHRFRSAEQEVRKLANELQKTNVEVEAVVAQMAALQKHALDDSENAEAGKGIIKVIRENFSWAYPAIKDVAKAIWPTVLAAIDT